MHDDEAILVHHAEGNKTFFSVILTVIDARQNFVLENQGCVEKVDATAFEDLLALGLIPFEKHSRPL